MTSTKLAARRGIARALQIRSTLTTQQMLSHIILAALALVLLHNLLTAGR